MSVSPVLGAGLDGRVRGHYVYVLLCQDDGGPIYAKVGHTHSPLQRFLQLKSGCGVTPRRMFYCPVPSDWGARDLEKNILWLARRWRTAGEWLKLDVADKKEFNKVLKRAYERSKTGCTEFRWHSLCAKEMIKQAEARKEAYKERMRRWCPSRRDAMADGAAYK